MIRATGARDEGITPARRAHALLQGAPATYTGAAMTIDARDLLRGLAAGIAASGHPADARHLFMERIDAFFDTVAAGSYAGADDEIRHDLEDYRRVLAARIEQVLGDAPVMPPVRTESPVSGVARRIKRLAEMVPALPLHHTRITVSDTSVNTRAMALCARFGLRGLMIGGDACATAHERAATIAWLERHLEQACRLLGVREHAFGDSGCVRLSVTPSWLAEFHGRYIRAGETGMSAPEIAVTRGSGAPPTAVLLAHEWTHSLDNRLAMLALRAGAFTRGGADEYESAFFSHMSDAAQSRLPQAKAALRELFSVLDEPGESGRTDALAAFENAALIHLQGAAGFLGMAPGQERRLRELLACDDHGLARALALALQDPGQPVDNLLHRVARIDISEVADPDGPGDFIGAVAGATGFSREKASIMLKAVCDTTREQLRAVAEYENGMSRYVENPAPMIRAGARELSDYPNRATEALSRLVGRDTRPASMLRTLMRSRHWMAQPLPPERLAVLNRAFAALARAGGYELTDEGPRLGFAREMEVARAAALLRPLADRLERAVRAAAAVARVPVRAMRSTRHDRG